MSETLKIDRPVSGRIIRHKAPGRQADAQEVLGVIDELLALPGVLAVGWTQYTPYFNDGEPCEFSVREAVLKLDPEVYGTVKDEDVYEFPNDENWVSSYGLKEVINSSLPYNERYRGSNYRKELNGVSTVPLIEALKKWNESEFESVLLENFGDHARVIATTEGFEVEYQEHE